MANSIQNKTAWAGKRCLVLGGSGFIGKNLCLSLREKTEVRAFASEVADIEGIEWRKGLFGDENAMRDAVRGCAYVFHLISTTTPASSNEDIEGDARQNLLGTLRLLEICREEKVEKIVFASSGGTVYGEPQQIPIPETHPTDPLCAYGISKLAIEKYLALYQKLYGLPSTVLRISNPYGPYQTGANKQGIIGTFITKALSGETLEIWGDGSIVRDYVYISDVVRALEAACLYQGETPVFNIGSGVGTSINQIIDGLQKVLDRPLAVEYRPSRSLDVSASILDCSLAQRELEWSCQVPLAEGLLQTMRLVS